MNDEDLVRRARAGDFEAFETLVTQSEGRIYHHLLRMVGNAEDARDLLQETYLSAFRKLGSFQGGAAFSTWVYRIATNHALMRLRKKRPEMVGLDELPAPSHEEIRSRSIADWPIDPREAVLRKETRRHLDQAIEALPTPYRAVVLLRDVEGLDTEETAQVLGISAGAVKTRLHRARIALREALSPYFEAEARAEGERNPWPRS